MKKQTYIALSIMKVEFIVYSTIVYEAIWLGSFFFFGQRLGIIIDVFESMPIYNDSQTTNILYVKDPKYYGRTKHIDTKNNFKKRYYCKKRGDPEYLLTYEMIVDPFTKSIPRNLFLFIYFYFICKVVRTI